MLTPRRLRLLLLAALAVMFLLAALQFWSAYQTHRVVAAALEMPKGPKEPDFERERLRQEMIAKRIENDSKALIWTNFASALAATIGVVLSIAGALGTALAYVDTRDKERRDRLDALLKDREDRLATALSETLSRLVSAESRERAVGATGLIYFFSPDRADFHLQALAALIAAARNPKEEEDVRQSLRLAVEQAVRSIDNRLLRQLSWQHVQLQKANFIGCDLSGLDLRDADLHDARLGGAMLVGTDLTAAQLQGADFSGTDLAKAILTYADMAGGSIAGASLPNTVIDGLKLLNLDVEGAKIGAGVTGWRDLPWEAARNWRLADFDPAIRAVLDERYGAAAPPLNVLMLVWEMPPNFVAGGTWTACYHLIRKLRRRGANVTVVAPWQRDLIADSPFETDVPIVGLGIVPPTEAQSPYGSSWSPYGAPSRGPYGGGWSPYGQPSGGWNAYGQPSRGTPGWSAYGQGFGAYGSYGADPVSGGSALYRMIGEFSRRLEAYLADHPTDLIHAHDWVTFDAARNAAEASGTPWIAHFHSTETERQHGRESPLTLRIEQMAVDVATRIIVPSRVTADLLHSEYHAAAAKIDIIPNLLSGKPPSAFNMGRFETRRVVFAGRLSRQKGVDLFIAAMTRARQATSLTGEVIGTGEEGWTLPFHGLNWRGALPWGRREEAFRGASAVIVPSRFEPFGMVILEAMQHRVPVIYTRHAGAAEVLDSGVKVDPEDAAGIAGQIVRLLGDLGDWEAIVRAQAREIDAYVDRDYDERVIRSWSVAYSGVLPEPATDG